MFGNTNGWKIKLHIPWEENSMKRYAQLAFLKALVITVGFDLICNIYGVIPGNPYRISLLGGELLFAVLFSIGLIEYLWKNRKN